MEAGKTYTVDMTLADSYNNQTALHLVLRGEQPAYFPAAAPPGGGARKPALRFEVTRNLLKAVAADGPAPTRWPANLVLLRGSRRLEIRPSYCQNGENVYLYDLRAGLPDSLRFGNITKKFDRQVLIPAGKETNYATAHLNLLFGPHTLFDNLYLSTAYKPEPTGSGFWTVGSPLQPLYYPATLTLKPAAPPADPARTAIYAATLAGGKAYVGGQWDEQRPDYGRHQAVRLLPPPHRYQGPRGQPREPGRRAARCFGWATICRAWPATACSSAGSSGCCASSTRKPCSSPWPATRWAPACAAPPSCA